ncbi:hypothetical protein Y032_0554g3362 [Ancylostoma ceylanicum]|uniref:Organic Anion Transporter Polypeptide family protein n=1 Tax=Ancylostoma ceylanicum TaxID=53326 RepID=A0A016WRB1_9BILA|nr:hypothetical protein Y032_0554g3362 [Ancylostoma ceylanicum]
MISVLEDRGLYRFKNNSGRKEESTVRVDGGDSSTASTRTPRNRAARAGIVKSIWSDCSCLQENFTTNPEILHSDTLVQGYCNIDCGHSVYILMVTLFITVVASFASGIPTQQIMLRVVPFDQRTLALGINWTFLRLLGFIPGGILFGMMIDIACLDWEEKCGTQQSCRVYDPTKLSWTITAVAIVCKLLSILATILGYMTYRPTDLDNAASIRSVDSHGALQLVVNDDRPPEEFGPKTKSVEKSVD